MVFFLPAMNRGTFNNKQTNKINQRPYAWGTILAARVQQQPMFTSWNLCEGFEQLFEVYLFYRKYNILPPQCACIRVFLRVLVSKGISQPR